LSSLDADLDAISAMAADLGKQLDAPKEVGWLMFLFILNIHSTAHSHCIHTPLFASLL
jgi:hypothetical protein